MVRKAGCSWSEEHQLTLYMGEKETDLLSRQLHHHPYQEHLLLKTQAGSYSDSLSKYSPCLGPSFVLTCLVRAELVHYSALLEQCLPVLEDAVDYGEDDVPHLLGYTIFGKLTGGCFCSTLGGVIMEDILDFS